MAPPKPLRVIVSRRGALGDVILLTPVIRRLKRENPDVPIEVITQHAIVFSNNPHVASINDQSEWPNCRPVLLNMDLAYEKRPTIHVADAFLVAAFGDPGEPQDRRQELFWPELIDAAGKGDRGDLVALHAAVTWPSRTLSPAFWTAVARLFVQKGHRVGFVGSPSDFGFSEYGVADLRGAYTLPQLAGELAKARVFVGSDSGLLHVVGACETPIVGLFTSASPSLRLPYRGRCIAIQPDGLTCVGCLHRRPAPVSDCYCERGDYLCTRSFDPNRVVDAALAFEYPV